MKLPELLNALKSGNAEMLTAELIAISGGLSGIDHQVFELSLKLTETNSQLARIANALEALQVHAGARPVPSLATDGEGR